MRTGPIKLSDGRVNGGSVKKIHGNCPAWTPVLHQRQLDDFFLVFRATKNRPFLIVVAANNVNLSGFHRLGQRVVGNQHTDEFRPTDDADCCGTIPQKFLKP